MTTHHPRSITGPVMIGARVRIVSLGVHKCHGAKPLSSEGFRRPRPGCRLTVCRGWVGGSLSDVEARSDSVACFDDESFGEGVSVNVKTMNSMARRMFELVEPVGVIPYSGYSAPLRACRRRRMSHP
jgi:hypothetical protein